jgi:hypothetical protein
MNRTPTEFVELGVQPARRTFLRFSRGFQAIERYYEVEKTTTNTRTSPGAAPSTSR